MPSLPRIERHRYGRARSQRAELWLPSGRGPHRVVVVLHGGSWQAKYGKWVMWPACADLVRRGVAAWNVEYRRLGRGQGGGWPATFDDVAAAVDLLPDVARGRLDLDDVRVLGHSAGGQLALWAAARSQRDWRVRFVRVAAQAAPAHMARGRQTAYDFLGGSPEQVPERYAAADPIQLVPLGVPIRLVHGAEDATVSIDRSREFMAAARAAGDHVELVEPAPGGHRVHIDPRTEAWRAAAEFVTATGA
jgi:acetyl esterase/lipase